jgi:hypothetical protein
MSGLNPRAQRLAILMEDFFGFPQALQEDARILPQMMSPLLLSEHSPSHYSLIILSSDAI